jgi:hypothetical protein
MTIDWNGAATAQANRVCGGPLAPHFDGFVALLAREGYASNTVQAKCELVVDLSRWLEQHKLPLVELDEERLRRFHIGRRRRFGVRRIDAGNCSHICATSDAFLPPQRGLTGHHWVIWCGTSKAF